MAFLTGYIIPLQPPIRGRKKNLRMVTKVEKTERAGFGLVPPPAYGRQRPSARSPFGAPSGEGINRVTRRSARRFFTQRRIRSGAGLTRGLRFIYGRGGFVSSARKNETTRSRIDFRLFPRRVFSFEPNGLAYCLVLRLYF